jgi:hypothetical protein
LIQALHQVRQELEGWDPLPRLDIGQIPLGVTTFVGQLLLGDANGYAEGPNARAESAKGVMRALGDHGLSIDHR